MPPAHVALHDVSKSFGALRVLAGVSLEVARGEVVALIGPSGSGKSTLLRCINGLEAHDAGVVSVLGFDAPRADVLPRVRETLWRPVRRRIGFVFQAFHLYPHRSALDNVTLAPMTVLRMERDAAVERARELLARVGLAEKADAMPHELSGGQRQRVAIARALAMEPDVLLFDEPTSALDPETVGEVLEVIRDLVEEHARTMLIVTHELEFAKEASDRVAFLDGGRIVEVGPSEQVLDDPRQPRTREFLERRL